MIAKKELPVIIGVGISPGMVLENQPGQPTRGMRYNRSFEFDGTNDYFPNYVINELLPAVEQLKTQNGREIHISPNPNDRMTMGMSSGGIGAFTLAWLRPDQFRRVYSIIGTFVPMRGGNEYPVLIRKTEPKPIRVFLEDGTNDAWNPVFGMWYDANLNMESALRFAGYDVAHAWGTHGHDDSAGKAVFPDVMRWLWRDYPNAITPLHSENDWLCQLVLPGEVWQKIAPTCQGATSLATDAKGDVYLSDAPANSITRISADGSATSFLAMRRRWRARASVPTAAFMAACRVRRRS